jgi:hypothetical protein
MKQLKKSIRERGIPEFNGIKAEDFGKHTKRKKRNALFFNNLKGEINK